MQYATLPISNMCTFNGCTSGKSTITTSKYALVSFFMCTHIKMRNTYKHLARNGPFACTDWKQYPAHSIYYTVTQYTHSLCSVWWDEMSILAHLWYSEHSLDIDFLHVAAHINVFCDMPRRPVSSITWLRYLEVQGAKCTKCIHPQSLYKFICSILQLLHSHR